MAKVKFSADSHAIDRVYDVPVVINGHSGEIDTIVISAKKQDDALFLLQIINSPDLVIHKVILSGNWDKQDTREDWQQNAPSGLIISPGSDGVKIGVIQCMDLHECIRIESDNCVLSGGRIENASGDFIRDAGDNNSISAFRCTGSLGYYPWSKYHRDILHIAPKGKRFQRGGRYIGIDYTPNGHKWEAEPQGILASDGSFSDVTIMGCRLDGVHPAHGISFLVNATGCRISDNQTNGLIRIQRQGNEVFNNQGQVQFTDSGLTKGNDMSNTMKGVSEHIILNAAHALKVQPAIIRALIRVEDGTQGRLLFESHVFWKQCMAQGVDIPQTLAANPDYSEVLKPTPYKSAKGKQGHEYYGKYSDSIRRLALAAEINEQAAYSSVSVGFWQIMGHHHEKCGFQDAKTFIESMIASADVQVEALATVIESMGIAEHLRNQDFTRFAVKFVGPAYKRGTATIKDDYDYKLSQFYLQELAKELPKKPLNPVSKGASRTVRTAVTGKAVAIGGSVATAAVTALSENQEAIKQALDTMGWQMWVLMGGIGLIVLMLAFIIYRYYVDRGYQGDMYQRPDLSEYQPQSRSDFQLSANDTWV